ncbi:hypothetical protein ASPCAL14719 [Aspergillus calidoustus]|uniref:BTB domain-containing protein n=1 Tax=Aspergillus calidoustus TaxID=454130 RepID=A0A0U5GIL2_ASPCI|nr:hypothetical protein ASPCAL14719 [Aspergillus calidoustus]
MEPEIFDPDGDLILTCTGVPLLVSSKAISLASSVLRTTLMEQEAETRIVKQEHPQTPTVVLAHNCLESFHAFCDVVHHKTESLPQNPDTDYLYRLAVFTGDYCCRAAMKDRGQIWLMTLRLIDRSEEDLWKLLQFAYILKLRKNCFDISRRLVATRLNRFRVWSFALETDRLMPDTILDNLDEKRESVGRSVQCAIMDLVVKLGLYDCKQSKDFLFEYLRSLNEVGILPGSSQFAEKNYLQIYAAAKNLARAVYANHEGCACSKYAGYKQRVELMSLLDKCYETMGLCLECVEGVHYEGHPNTD